MPRRKEIEITHLQERAFNLFVEGIPEYEIAERLGVSRNTIAKWRKEQDWVQRRSAIQQRARLQLDKMREQALIEAYKTLDELEKLAVEALQTQLHNKKIRFRSLERAIEVLTHLQEVKAKILGLNSPEKTQVTATQVNVNLGELLKELYPLSPYASNDEKQDN